VLPHFFLKTIVQWYFAAREGLHNPRRSES
jgi:hypothetical protein